MQSIKNRLKAFFNFNKRQEQGAFVLIVLIIIAINIDLLLPVIFKEKPYDYTSALTEIEAWKASGIKNEPEKNFKSDNLIKKEIKPIILNPISFNPNKFPEEKWIQMGMPERVIKTILNYEAKGGYFKKKEDLQKIYGLSPEIYNQLEDFIEIPIPEKKEHFKDSPLDKEIDVAKTIVPLDINRTDSVSLLQIPGIGPFYAGQIIKYRSQLGGYNSLEQLGEIYKMDSNRLNAFLPYLIFKDTTLNQIDVNSADFKTVLRHPYFDYETTKKIFNLRNKLGRFAGMYQLKNDTILSDSLFKKLEPYIKVD